MLTLYCLIFVSQVLSFGASPTIFRPRTHFHVNVTMSKDKLSNRFVCYGAPCGADAWFHFNIKCPTQATLGLFIDIVPTDYPEQDETKHVTIRVGDHLVVQCKGIGTVQNSTAAGVPWQSAVSCVRLDVTEMVKKSPSIRIAMKTSKHVNSNHVAGELSCAHFGARISWQCVPSWTETHNNPKFTKAPQQKFHLKYPGLTKGCVKWKMTVKNGDRTIGCAGVMPGYYWQIGKYVRDYGYYGVYVSYPAYNCGPETVGLVGETWRWWNSGRWSPVSKRMCRGLPSREQRARAHRNTPWCNVTDKDGPTWGQCTHDNPSCPCCGIYQAECKKISV